MIANCEFFYNSQSIESQGKEYAMNNITRDHAPLLECATRVFISTITSIAEMSIRRYFKSAVNLPTPSQAQLSPNVLREVNQAVTAALEREEAGNQAKRGKKRKYNASFTPEDRAAIGRYAAENGNAAAKIEGVACPLGNSQSLKSQSGLYSAIRNRLTTQSKPGLRYIDGGIVRVEVLLWEGVWICNRFLLISFVNPHHVGRNLMLVVNSCNCIILFNIAGEDYGVERGGCVNSIDSVRRSVRVSCFVK